MIALLPMVFFTLGVIAITLFYSDIYIPIWMSVAIFIAVSVSVVWLFACRRLGGLILLLWLVYALPFIHIVPYLWFGFGIEHPDNLWGLAVNPYMIDKTIIELTAMIGAVGACGFAAGAMLFSSKIPSPAVPAVVTTDSLSAKVVRIQSGLSSLSIPGFCVWIAFGVLCSWLYAPQDTIFQAVYTQSKSISQGWNFSSLWMVSYAFILFAFSDALLDPVPGRARVKRWIAICAVLVIVIWFQLLRGDRESLTMVVALVLMYNIWARGFAGAKRWRAKLDLKKIGVFVFLVFSAAFFFGYLRDAMTSVSGVDSFVNRVGGMNFDHFVSGTWSGALMSPLSVAGDYLNGKLSFKYGQTYLDLLASIIPGFAADWVGYARPYSSTQNPAWDMTYGIGGTHAVVVPFMNFSMAGVFVIVALWSFILPRVERYALNSFSQPNLALLGTIVTASAHWLWYGEKAIMNALILWGLLSVLYRIRFDSIKIQDNRLASAGKKTVREV